MIIASKIIENDNRVLGTLGDDTNILVLKSRYPDADNFSLHPSYDFEGSYECSLILKEDLVSNCLFLVENKYKLLLGFFGTQSEINYLMIESTCLIYELLLGNPREGAWDRLSDLYNLARYAMELDICRKAGVQWVKDTNRTNLELRNFNIDLLSWPMVPQG